MPYATYYLHTQTLVVNIRDIYQKYDVAMKRFKDDAEEFIQITKNIKEIKYINKKNEIK
jgi:hypothetical protein